MFGLDYNIFEASFPIIKVGRKRFNNPYGSLRYIWPILFLIYTPPGLVYLPPHTHLNQLDKNKYLKLAKQKFSLVHYISGGRPRLY